jgi:hypothetical protein
LPKSVVAQTLGKQVLRAGTSVGAHYREGTRSRSSAEFVSKLEGAQPTGGNGYWICIPQGSIRGPLSSSEVKRMSLMPNDLFKETHELEVLDA